MKHTVLAVLGVAATFCFAAAAFAWNLETVADTDDLEAIVDVAWTNNSLAKIIPPGDFDYNNTLGVIAYEDGFDTNFLAALLVVTNGTGTNAFLRYPVEVIETTNGSDRVRYYMSAISTNPTVVHTTTVSIANYPEDWIEAVYGEAPEWLSGAALQQWYDDRDPWRQHVYCDLIATSSIPDYVAWLTNSIPVYSDGTNTNSLLTVYSNDIAFVEIESGSGGIDLYLHAPTNVPTLDLFKSTNLLETYGWTLPATLDHTLDPILWTYTGADSPAFFASGNAAVDTDGDGLADIREIRMHGTSIYLADSDGDGLNDGVEVMTYGLNPLSADSDGDGIPDDEEVASGTNPNSADSDGDGLTDYEEIYTYFGHVDPLDADTDDDGLSDYAELVTYGTYPRSDDTDQDNLTDYEEVITYSTNPLLVDSDSDGMYDYYEVYYGFDPNNAADAAEDEDSDGFNNLTEYKWMQKPTSSNSTPPQSQLLIVRPPGTNVYRSADFKLLAIGDLGDQSALVRVRPFWDNDALAGQLLHHSQTPGMYINGTEASSLSTPISVAASGSATEYKITAAPSAVGTNLHVWLTTTNDPGDLEDQVWCYPPYVTSVNFWGPGSANYVDVYHGQTNTLWIGMPADTNDCRVRMCPYQNPTAGYGIPNFHQTDHVLAKVTGTGADPSAAALNTFDWQSAYGVWYNDPHWTRGIRLDYGAYTFEVGYDWNANGTLEAAEVQETCDVYVPRLEIQAVKGLYKEDGTYEEGYTSTNDLGRIYCNRVYSPTNPATLLWSNDHQYVDIEVKVFPEGLPIPTNAEIAWYYDDPDDPSDASISSNSAVVVDPNDYNSTDSDGDGSDVDGNDNTGSRDGADQWEQIESAYALSGNDTLLSNGVSKVRFNVTDDGGDNFVLRAKFLRPGSSTPIVEAETGIMTVWKRIQAEYREMVPSDTLPLDDVQEHYNTSFVEWDFQDEGSCTNHEYISPTPGATAYCAKWDGVGAGQFHHRGDGGWHFVASARKYASAADATPYGVQTNGTATVQSDYVLNDPSASFTPGAFADWHIVEINPGSGNSFSFIADDNTATTITVKPFKYTKPDSTLIRTLHHRSSELGLGTNITYQVREGGVSGITPGPLDPNVLVFHETIEHIQAHKTNAPPLNEMLLGTLVHELMHSFDLHHNCGNADIGGMKSCAGSWSFAPVFYPDGSYEVLPESTDFCGEHIKAIRQSNGYGAQ